MKWMGIGLFYLGILFKKKKIIFFSVEYLGNSLVVGAGKSRVRLETSSSGSAEQWIRLTGHAPEARLERHL